MRLHDLLYHIEELQEILAENDEIPKEEDMLYLEDLGYKNMWGDRNGIWEKILEDTEEKEVVEEIPRLHDPLRRIRTTH